MLSDKKEIIEFIKQLPINVSLERIIYHLYVKLKIKKAMKDVEEGKTVPHKEVMIKFEK